jgi:UDP-N-acetylmuramoyl-tripeptide--D-alanyl-D-alanine ligase
MAALGGDISRLSERNAGSFLARAMFRVRPWHRFSAIEVGVNGPDTMQPNVAMIQPDIVVVTSIGSEHNRSFKTLEATRHEKAEMVRGLPEDGLAVLNGDDPNVLWMASQTRGRVITFGFEPSNAVRAEDLAFDWPRGMRFKLLSEGEAHEVHTCLVGRHMVYSILAAAATCVGEGVDLDEALPRVETVEPTPDRMQIVPLEGGAFLLRDDYKSSMETIETALETLAEIPAKNRVLVLGEISEPVGGMGPAYKRIGELAARAASEVILVTGKRAMGGYRSGLYRGGLSRESFVCAGRSALAAAQILDGSLQPGDVVLVKDRDNQRLERVAFSLMGQKVRCDLTRCYMKATRCGTCSLLGQGPLV